MAKRRLLGSSLGSSRKFAELPRIDPVLGEFAQVLYPLLVTHTDDFGRQSGDAFTVKHAVFPTSLRPESDFETALQALHRVGLIIWYDVDDCQVIEITGFDTFQTGLHKRTKSKFPPPDIGKFREIPGNSLLTERNETERNGTEKSAERAVNERKARAGSSRGQTFDGERIRVPTFLHEEFVRALGKSDFNPLTWYPKLDAELIASGESFADELSFIRQRFWIAAGLDRKKILQFHEKPPVYWTPPIDKAASHG